MVRLRQKISSLRFSMKRVDWFLVTILLITVGVVWLNFKSDVWLTGWDTLHPEFNYGLNIRRLVSGVWREDQGLGALAAHAHMSDLPRVLVLWLSNLIFPVHVVKSIYVSLCLILGPIGVYFFLKYILSRHDKNQTLIGVSAFLASLFYLFNLNTVQHFYVVFEMFAVQYAALGWLFYSASLYLDQQKNKFLIFVFIVNFLASPMAYAPLLWYVYFASLLAYLTILLILRRDRFRFFFKHSFLIIAITLAANLYWVLPNLYYIFSGAGSIPQQAHINRLFSDEAFLQNKMYGNLDDLILFKNFLFNWAILSPRSNTLVPLMEVWDQHLSDTYVTEIGYGLSLVFLLGLVALIKKRNSYFIALIPVFFGSIFMLLSENPPLGWLFRWMRAQSSIIEEATRFPFTKFSLIFLLTAVCFFAFGLREIFLKLNKSNNKSFLHISFSILIVISLLSYSLPYFRGELISSKMEHQIPEVYFDLFEWFEGQPQGRILVLPMHSPFGWKYHSWGYEGAGFIWFGLDHPVLERDFDRWSPYNETLYQQISHALYEQDKLTFINLLNKYNIRYLLLDQSTITTGDPDLLWYEETKQMFDSQDLELMFDQEFIQVYEFYQDNQLVYALPNLPKIQQISTYARKDFAYQQTGNYLTVAENEIIYPYADIFQNRQNQVELEKKQDFVAKLNRSFTAEDKIYYFDFADQNFKGRGLTYQLEASINQRDQLVVTIKLPLVIRVDQEILIEFTPISLIFDSEKLKKETDRFILTINNAEFEISQLLSKPSYIALSVDQLLQASLLMKNDEEITKQLYTGEIGSNLWDQLRSDLNEEYLYQAEQDIEIVAEFTTTPIAPLLEDVGQFDNCDLFQRGRVKKQIKDGTFTLQASNNGAACYTIGLKASNQQGYLLAIDSKNVQGHPLKLSIYNWQTKRLDVLDLVKEDGYNFYSILDRPLLLDNYYSLHLGTRSFGDTVINEINDLSLYPYPLTLISGLRIRSSSSNVVSNRDAVTHSKISEWQKIGTYLYIIQVENEGGYLALSQSYDSAWLGIGWNNLFDFEVLSHAKLNGWANAWEVPAGQRKIVLIFWPQVFQFVGFGATLGGLLTLVFLAIDNKKKKDHG